MNGVLVNGAQPADKFVTVIDAELAKAKERIACGGLPRSHLRRDGHDQLRASPAVRAGDPDEGRHDDRVERAGRRGPLRAALPTAPVTIVEFADFQCPYCKRVEETLAKVRNIYGDRSASCGGTSPSLPPRALPAAELAREARAEKGEAGFWTVHDALFASQPRLEEADLEAVARTAGLDLAKVTTPCERQVQDRHRRRTSTWATTSRRAARLTSSSTAAASSARSRSRGSRPSSTRRSRTRRTCWRRARRRLSSTRRS